MHHFDCLQERPIAPSIYPNLNRSAFQPAFKQRSQIKTRQPSYDFAGTTVFLSTIIISPNAMCLPCYPWVDVYLEEEPKPKQKKAEEPGNAILYMDPKSRTLVKLTNTTVSNMVLLCSSCLPALCRTSHGLFRFWKEGGN